VAKLDALRETAQKIIAASKGEGGVKGCDLDDITSFAEKIGAIFEDIERHRAPNYDKETPLEAKTRCVAQTPSIVKTIWSDEALMTAAVYCLCHPDRHSYANQEFSRCLKPDFAPLVQWVLTGHVFEVLGSDGALCKAG
jgi:hypothetical protein